MEAFEHIVKVYLESQGYIVNTNIKFPVKRKTKKVGYDEYQTHGYEVDIVASKSNSLLLGSVKSFFGSTGVNKQGFKGLANGNKPTDFAGYKMFNIPEVRKGIVEEASKRYGYPHEQIQMLLFVGNFKPGEGQEIEAYLNGKNIKVINLHTIIEGLLKAAEPRTYLNDPVIVTIKALQQLKLIKNNNNVE